MNKEQVLNLMNAIDPDLIEEADLPIAAKRRMPRFARTGLIAACVCLALVGSAFAANPEAMAALIDRLNVHIVSTEEDTSYTVEGGPMTKYPLSAFSPALNAASEGRDGPVVSLSFDTWNEVREFVGGDIPLLLPQSEGDENRRFTVYLFHTGSDRLWGVDINVAHVTDLVHSEIEFQIRTELWQGENAKAGLAGSDGAFTQMESHPMTNGITAEIIQYTGPADFPHANCKGYFMKDGILYSVKTFATVSTVEDAASRLYAILDSFS